MMNRLIKLAALKPSLYFANRGGLYHTIESFPFMYDERHLESPFFIQ